MRKFSLLIGLLCVFTVASAQMESFKPIKVAKPVAFDKTKPLREMRVILPGEKDRSWKDKLVGNIFIESPDWQGEDNAVQRENGPNANRGIESNFDGVSNLFGGAPPDTDGDCGPDHYFQMINVSFAIYDKSGNILYGPADNSTIWDGFNGPWNGHNDGDPIILYDEEADRWIASQFAVDIPGSGDYELIAVSVTGDPTGEWYRYAYEYEHMNDYPKMSVWPDAYYCTYNMFSGPSTFEGAALAAFDREAMLAGDPDAATQFFQMTTSTYGILCADVDGDFPPEDAPNYLCHMKRSGAKKIQVYECTIDWDDADNSSLELVTEISPASYSAPSSFEVEQPNGSGLDSFMGRLLFRLQYRNFGTHESMVMNHAVVVDGHSAIRWYELRMGEEEWEMYQQGTYSPDDDNRWMGSICMQSDGSIALGYTVSGPSTYPGIRFTGRTADAPLGYMNIQETEIIPGGGNQQSWYGGRWGDYACMSPDPTDPNMFWHTNEYSIAGGSWRTRIASFYFDEDAPAPDVNAGNDGVICSNENFPIEGASISNAISSVWSTSGDGYFNPDANSLSTTYMLGAEDKVNGEVTLTLTAEGFAGGGSQSDDLLLVINPEPTPNAGNDTTICHDATLQLNSSADHYSSIFWFKNGDGSFNNASIEAPIYTPGPGDIANGTVNLTMVAQPIAPCSSANNSTITVTITTCDAIEQIENPISINVLSNPNAGEFILAVDGYNAKNAQMTISTMTGAMLFSEKLSIYGSNYEKPFDMSAYPKGVYLVTVRDGSSTRSEKIIIQ